MLDEQLVDGLSGHMFKQQTSKELEKTERDAHQNVVQLDEQPIEERHFRCFQMRNENESVWRECLARANLAVRHGDRRLLENLLLERLS